MGWAKYQEDNFELMYDRQYMQETPQYRPTTQTVCTEKATLLTYTVANKNQPYVVQGKLFR